MNATTDFLSTTIDSCTHHDDYLRLWHDSKDADSRAQELLDERLATTDWRATDLPDDPFALEDWMRARHERIGAEYRAYLDHRARGGPRRFFQSRAQAFFYLRCIAPTKLVDGAWLHGLTRYWHDLRLRPLVRTYLEELGDGHADKNHVLIYRRLLARYGCENPQGLADDCYQQGALQLALGRQAKRFLPEVIGFNLGYEQPPLHLLITAHELAELNIDPYYFTLHITIDNIDVGHAHKAIQSVLDVLPALGGQETLYRRVRRGFALNDAGPCAATLAKRFDAKQEMIDLLQRKAGVGRHMHADHSHLGGRRLNDWLADLADGRQGAAFLDALQRHGWIKRGQPAAHSRFWSLIEGERATMFGVFDGYERQVIHDWIVDDAMAAPPRRYAASRRSANSMSAQRGGTLPDDDERNLEKRLAELEQPEQRMALLSDMIAPARHFTPAGLLATRRFARYLDQL